MFPIAVGRWNTHDQYIKYVRLKLATLKRHRLLRRRFDGKQQLKAGCDHREHFIAKRTCRICQNLSTASKSTPQFERHVRRARHQDRKQQTDCERRFSRSERFEGDDEDGRSGCRRGRGKRMARDAAFAPQRAAVERNSVSGGCSRFTIAFCRLQTADARGLQLQEDRCSHGAAR